MALSVYMYTGFLPSLIKLVTSGTFLQKSFSSHRANDCFRLNFQAGIC